MLVLVLVLVLARPPPHETRPEFSVYMSDAVSPAVHLKKCPAEMLLKPNDPERRHHPAGSPSTPQDQTTRAEFHPQSPARLLTGTLRAAEVNLSAALRSPGAPPSQRPQSRRAERKYQRVLLEPCGYNLRGGGLSSVFLSLFFKLSLRALQKETLSLLRVSHHISLFFLHSVDTWLSLMDSFTARRQNLPKP